MKIINSMKFHLKKHDDAPQETKAEFKAKGAAAEAAIKDFESQITSLENATSAEAEEGDPGTRMFSSKESMSSYFVEHFPTLGIALSEFLTENVEMSEDKAYANYLM